MNTQSNPSEHAATTTEELIVQYLDGELVRKELEAVLFERLAHSADARSLLREHLVVRGAIRDMMDHEPFQLSSELDARTRGRIEEMLKQGVAVPGVIALERDASAVASNPATRRLNRWSMRPAIAALVLLLAVGSTWYLTRSVTESSIGGKSMSQNQPSVAQSSTSDLAPATTSASNILPDTKATTVGHPTPSPSPSGGEYDRPREIVRIVKVPVPASSTREIAQTSETNNSVQTPASSTMRPAASNENSDPADIMISHRYAKILNATSKREVLVSGKDRL